MAFKATKAIAAAFDEAGLKYSIIEPGGSSAVKAVFGGDNYDSATVHYISSDDDNDVKVVILSFVKVPASKREKVIMVLNDMNNKYRYLKFVMSEDNDVRVEYDFPLKITNPGDVAVEILIRMMKILDDVYPELMKAIWS